MHLCTGNNESSRICSFEVFCFNNVIAIIIMNTARLGIILEWMNEWMSACALEFSICDCMSNYNDKQNRIVLTYYIISCCFCLQFPFFSQYTYHFATVLIIDLVCYRKYILSRLNLISILLLVLWSFFIVYYYFMFFRDFIICLE